MMHRSLAFDRPAFLARLIKSIEHEPGMGRGTDMSADDVAGSHWALTNGASMAWIDYPPQRALARFRGKLVPCLAHHTPS
jgi:hypothetical protein